MTRFLRGALVAVGLVWLGIQLEFPTWVIRYRLTLIAEVDGREVSGSGVVETRWTSEGFLTELTGRPWDVSLRGEAVVVDLGARGTLFALLRRDRERQGSHPDPEHMVSRTFADASVGSMTSSLLRKTASSRAPVALELRRLPLLVRFRDIADPKSVERVDPADLAASFGEGVRLTGATIAIVPSGWWPFGRIGWPRVLAGEPVTTGIEKRLVWLDGLGERSLSGTSDFRPAISLADRLGELSFRWGMK